MILFAAGGHGSYAPFIILFGLSSVPFFLIPNSFTFFLPILYFTGCTYIWSLLRKGRIARKYLFILATVHLLGVVISILIYKKRSSGFFVPGFTLAMSYAIPIVLLLSYWAFYILTLPRNKTGA